MFLPSVTCSPRPSWLTVTRTMKRKEKNITWALTVTSENNVNQEFLVSWVNIWTITHWRSSTKTNKPSPWLYLSQPFVVRALPRVSLIFKTCPALGPGGQASPSTCTAGGDSEHARWQNTAQRRRDRPAFWPYVFIIFKDNFISGQKRTVIHGAENILWNKVKAALLFTI